MTFVLRKDSWIRQKHNNNGARQWAVKELHSQPPGNADITIKNVRTYSAFVLVFVSLFLILQHSPCFFGSCLALAS